MHTAFIVRIYITIYFGLAAKSRGEELVYMYVIGSACKDEKAAECVDVCPVDCIEEGEDIFYIDPDVCISCGACEAACPVSAVFFIDALPESEKIYYEKALEFYQKKSG